MESSFSFPIAISIPFSILFRLSPNTIDKQNYNNGMRPNIMVVRGGFLPLRKNGRLPQNKISVIE